MSLIPTSLIILLFILLHTVTTISSVTHVVKAVDEKDFDFAAQVFAKKGSRKRRPPPTPIPVPAPPPPVSKDGFDLYILALQWPRTTCEKNYRNGTAVQTCMRRVPNPAQFKIHGLWPQNTRGGLLIKHSKKGFNKEGWSTQLNGELPDHWPNIVFKNNDAFWSHEWKYHGAFADFNQTVYYFNAANNLYRKLSIATLVNALRNANTSVQVGHPYDVPTLTAAFKEALGRSIQINCYSGQIWEIYIYLSPNNLATPTILVPPSEATPNCLKFGNITLPSP